MPCTALQFSQYAFVNLSLLVTRNVSSNLCRCTWYINIALQIFTWAFALLLLWCCCVVSLINISETIYDVIEAESRLSDKQFSAASISLCFPTMATALNLPGEFWTYLMTRSDNHRSDNVTGKDCAKYTDLKMKSTIKAIKSILLCLCKSRNTFLVGSVFHAVIYQVDQVHSALK